MCLPVVFTCSVCGLEFWLVCIALWLCGWLLVWFWVSLFTACQAVLVGLVLLRWCVWRFVRVCGFRCLVVGCFLVGLTCGEFGMVMFLEFWWVRYGCFGLVDCLVYVDGAHGCFGV